MSYRLVPPVEPLERPARDEVGVRLAGLVDQQRLGGLEGAVELRGVEERTREQESYVDEPVPEVVGLGSLTSSLRSTVASR